ncbi:hypothetical protein QJS04_geneDACA006924 [Acorus gramineus]|uniref:R13L1/DRL21-like LRR repeat region domain-containing protein n=1 Tax=Acorus gramineus TaxID=55184 RepID=A0AAV9AUC9_ACOGR|nr:hypothetical protein QJS04_geneDACA006924 [Acorus gramineus]
MMPAGIGELAHLQILSKFIIHSSNQNNEGEVSSFGSNIHELGSLSQLTHLAIGRLEKVQSGAEAKKAAMHGKTHLRNLFLSFNEVDGAVGEGEMKRLGEVFEELSPPSSLPFLEIDNFYGRELPSWMISTTSDSLLNLVCLVLSDVKFIQQLPSLGHLPHLKEFGMRNNQGIVDIGPEFVLGGGGIRRGSISPKLELVFF